MRITDTGDLWWKSAVVYCLDVETFMDWNDDGIGDLEGLAHRMDYLHELGITVLWLMPFYPTPNRDDGYDVSDYYGVDERLGNLGDFVEMMRMAKDRGIRVIIDLVVNHTSDRHPWFIEARKSKDNPHRDFYVWRDKPPRGKQEVVFPDVEDSVWELDEKTGQYYLHHFYTFQPDLNVTNPKVRDEVAKIMGFWLELGVSGFRVDAVPFLINPVGVQDADGELREPARLPEVAARLPRPPLGRGDHARRGEPPARPTRSSTSVVPTATASRCSSTSSGCSGSTSRSRDRIRRRSWRPWHPARRSRWSRSGRTSCATTTSSRSTSSPTRSGRRCSMRSVLNPRCRPSGAASSAGCRRCSRATRGASA